ncbi:MAG: pyridoxal 5'-phosphate synthase glutaminase subunit PdxT [Myxococcales bacterium]|nr:pyridoxal 5'-phosphate synthase glutaminase subunit PdxT [Myxococcales bacterium]
MRGIAGVLCLQGSSEPHLARLAELFAAGELAQPPREVRQQRDLDGLTHLILPGGESTTIRHLLDLFGMTDDLLARHRDGRLCLFGTCAGAILLAADDGTRPKRLALLDATLDRNAYGRQVDSFSEALTLELPEEHGAPTFHGVFIRAPRFTRIGPGVRVVARRGAEPVLVEAPGLLAGTFHPELTRDLRIHRHFVALKVATH